MTAHEHGRVVTTADGAPLKIRLAVKIYVDDEEEKALVVIRDPNDYSNCEHLTNIETEHRDSPSGHRISIQSRSRNAIGQEFEIAWRYSPNAIGDELRTFNIYLPASTPAHPINFIP